MSRPPIRTRIPTHTAEPPAAAASPVEVPQLLRLLHLASPALPIGAFHFSQGLEFVVDSGWIRNEAEALEWIGGVADASLATLDLPVLHRLHAAWKAGDMAAVHRWNSFLLASRETQELRAEDRHLGSALMRVLAELELRTDGFPMAHATAFAFACARWNIDSLSGTQAYAWAWVENQVLAAVKLVPLGQSAGQRMLHALNARLGALCTRAVDFMDSDIGVSTLRQGIASARHEVQYTRLFRS